MKRISIPASASRPRFWALLFAVSAGLGAPLAHAEPLPSPSTVSAADAAKALKLFNEGTQLLAQSKWAKAEEKLLAAWNLLPGVDVAVNLGQSQARLKKHRDAAERLEYAIRRWSTVTKIDTRDRASARLVEMKKEIGTLAVTVNVPGAAVRVNKMSAGTAPLDRELFVEPGDVEIEAQAPGYKPVTVRHSVEN